VIPLARRAGREHDAAVTYHPNYIGLAAVAVSLLAFRQAHHLLRPRSFPKRLLWLGILTILSLPALGFALHYLHLWREREWFYELRSWPGSEFLAVFLGAAGGACAAVLPRPALGLVLLGTLGLAILPHVKPLIGPLPDEAFRVASPDVVCMQSTPSTCGPASVVNILRHLGVESTEREVARAAFTYSGGTEAWYLARYARHRGLSARFDFRKSFAPEAGLPALVGVRLGSAGHFIAVLQVQNDQVSYVDPLRGAHRCSSAEFRSRHLFTGFHLVMQRRDPAST
jgi:Peptidase C39 family